MFWFRSRLHRLTGMAWLAVCAWVLAPAWSHAGMQAQSGTPALAEICTPQGGVTARMVWPGSAEDGPGAAWHGPAHGACCATGGVVPGMPPSGGVAVLLRVPGDAAPAVFGSAPRSRGVRRVAQPRAPPVPSRFA